MSGPDRLCHSVNPSTFPTFVFQTPLFQIFLAGNKPHSLHNHTPHSYSTMSSINTDPTTIKIMVTAVTIILVLMMGIPLTIYLGRRRRAATLTPLRQAARSTPRPHRPVRPLRYVTPVVPRETELDEEEAVGGEENVIRLEPIPSITHPATVVTRHESFIIPPIPTIIPPTPPISTPKSSSSFGGYDDIFTGPPPSPTAHRNRVRPSASTITQQSFKGSEMSVDYSNLPAEQVSSRFSID
jgi:hypothetical protein